MDKQLKDKAISIKGNKYVLVSDRIIYFNETYKGGSIRTRLLSEPQADMVVVQAKVIPNISQPEKYFSGLSQAKWGDGMVNKTSALENAETSAVGRALAMMGIGVIDSVASADEMNKAGVKDEPSKDIGDCPKCGSPLVEGKTKAGKIFHKCSTQTYDRETGAKGGCSYVNWDPTGKEAALKKSGKSISVEDYEMGNY